MASAEFMSFVERWRILREQNDTSEKLIEDILLYCQGFEKKLVAENQQLSNELKDVKLDLVAATSARRTLQQDIQEHELKIERCTQENEILKNRNPYILTLIDGDGLIMNFRSLFKKENRRQELTHRATKQFQDDLIQQGLEGGKKAANALRSAIASQCGDRVDEIEIIAKVYANVTGLARAMIRNGCIESIADLKEFTLGFTQAKASFDFIDVGYGKERADSKIKETTRWNLRNHNCKQILLGISHDTGYAPFLDEMLRDEHTRKCITVLEGFPIVRDLSATGVQTLDMPEDLFRRDKLIDRSPPPSSSTMHTQTNAQTYSQQPFSPVAAPPVRQTATPATSTTSATTPPISSASYATVMTSASPPPQIKLPLMQKSLNKTVTMRQKMPPQSSWSPGPRGLDDPVQASTTALDSVKKRKDTNKLCNNHYLRGPCIRRDVCPFVHNYRPTSDEIKAIALLSRLNPCTNGQECEVEGCIYGHHCPSVKDGVCTHPYCKFAVEAHPPGTKFKNPNIRDN